MTIIEAVCDGPNPKPIRIFITAFTHTAINHLLRRIAELRESMTSLLGPDRSAHWLKGFEVVKLCDPLTEAVGGGVKAVNKIPSSTDTPVVMGATIWRVYKELQASKLKGWFDIVVIDEASQLAVADSLLPICCLKPTVGRLLILGDTLQLPPIVAQNFPSPPPSSPNLHASILECLIRTAGNKPVDLMALARGDTACPEHLIKLNENHRMNTQLSKFTSRIYGRDYMPPPGNTPNRDACWGVDVGRLVNDSNDPWVRRATQCLRAIRHPSTGVLPSLVSIRLILCKPDGQPLTPSEILATPNAHQTVAEATLLASLMKVLSVSSQSYASSREAARAMFACTPHRRQRVAVRAALACYGDQDHWDGAVDTVERVQGQERPLVILCLGSFERGVVSRERDFLFSPQRLNVAISRAKQCAIVLYTDALMALNPDIISDPHANAAYSHLRAFVEKSRKIDMHVPLPL